MVGVCAVLGDSTEPPEEFVDAVTWRARETRESYATDGFSLSLSLHPLLAGDGPGRAADGDVLIWVWGDVYGHGSLGDHEPRDGPPDGSAAYCAGLYDRYGPGFVDELNGDFGLVVHDRAEGTVSFVTDRLATRPFFHTRAADGSLVVSSQSQALSLYPGVDARFEGPALYEYLQLRRVFGVQTPLEGVEEFPPGAVTTYDLEEGTLSHRSYWRPRYEPVDEPVERYVDRFVDTFGTVVDEWTRDDLDYGVLLSGGSDSRLVAAALDPPATAFHVADWMSREASVAGEAARTAGHDFRLLERDGSAEARALRRNPQIANFSGWFDQAYFTDFDAEIDERVDVLVSGLYADMLFGGGPLVTRSLSLGGVGTLSLPVAKPVDSIDAYVRAQTADAVDPTTCLPDAPPIEEVVADRVSHDGDGLVSHGVRYESLADLQMYGDFYPMGADTDAIFSRSLMHMAPYRTPFLDNRLLDLQQRIPREYFLRRNMVNRAVDRIAPDLAAIPHARTGVALQRPFAVDYVGGNLNGFIRKHVTEERPPARHLDHSPWPDRRALLRTKDFAVETLVENRSLLRALPAFDYEGCLECYRRHLRGEDTSTVLYALLTLLEMPVTERVVEADPGHRRRPAMEVQR